jgi:hypothetical protein
VEPPHKHIVLPYLERHAAFISPLQRPSGRSTASSNARLTRSPQPSASIRVPVFGRDPQPPYGLTRPHHIRSELRYSAALSASDTSRYQHFGRPSYPGLQGDGVARVGAPDRQRRSAMEVGDRRPYRKGTAVCLLCEFKFTSRFQVFADTR